MQQVFLDTDIGDDIDDAMALGLICRSPELSLVGVSTVFGNTTARAHQARTILKMAGPEYTRIPVAAGCGATLTARPMGFGGLKAYLENQLPNQDATCLPESELPPNDPRHGVDLLIDTLMAGDGNIIPITIGALTNMAMAMVKEPRIIAKIPRIVAMAAEFKSSMAEWNIRCDPEAAALVFASGIPIDVTTWEMGHLVQFTPAEIAQLRQAPSPLARHLARTIAAWQDHNRRPDWEPMPSLFDPLAVATMIKPELFQWRRGYVTVELQGSATYGYTSFREDPAGPHKVAWTPDRPACIDFYLGRLTPDVR